MDNFGHFFGLFGCGYEHIATETTMQSVENQGVAAKGCGGYSRERAETGGCDSKKFFLIKFTRSACEDGVVIALMGRVADEVLVIEMM